MNHLTIPSKESLPYYWEKDPHDRPVNENAFIKALENLRNAVQAQKKRRADSLLF